MHIISMLFLPALFLLSGVPRCVSEAAPTYEREDPSTGQTLICEKCRPGTHMVAHCTADVPTECAPCRKDHYTEYWNYLPRCLYCSNVCSGNQEVEKECTAVSNRVCGCREGFYMNNDYCIRHSECEPGHGVRTKGTSKMNTVCETCSNGSFSSSSSALEPCVSHLTCASGQIELLPGSIFHDTVCGSCEDFANRGEAFRTFLNVLLSNHRMHLPKMKRFVSRYIHNSSEGSRINRRAVPRRRGPLLDQIRAWLAQAPAEELKQLPLMLKATNLHSIQNKLVKRLNQIEQLDPNCSLSS